MLIFLLAQPPSKVADRRLRKLIPLRQKVGALLILTCRLSVTPRLGAHWQPGRGLRSRDGANPEKKITTEFGCGVHIGIVGDVIREVKADNGRLSRKTCQKRHFETVEPAPGVTRRTNETIVT